MPHNGKRVQINLNTLQIGGDFAFLNYLKQGSGWNYVTGNTTADVSVLDSDGYPTSVSNGGYQTYFYIPTQAQAPGNYRVKWSGAGTVAFPGMSYTIVSGALTGTDGQVVISTTDTTFHFAITATGTPHITNVSIVNTNETSLYDSGEIFRPDFLTKVSQFGTIRFLNWTVGNISNLTQWSDRLPTTHWSYNADHFPSAYFANSPYTTTNSGSAYSVAKTGFTLADKATVTFKLASPPTTGTSWTLNVNSTGAVTVATPYGTDWDPTNYAVPQAGWSTATYDARLNRFILNNPSTGVDYWCGILAGVPPEICVALCNKVGAHCWLNIPYLAADGGSSASVPVITDYTSQLATYCSANLNSGLKLKAEVSNEVWNFGAGFFCSKYAQLVQNVRSASLDQNNWYGTACSVVYKAINTVYAGDTTKYDTIIGFQTYGGTTGSVLERLNSDWYVANGGTAAKTWATRMCAAGYYNSGYIAGVGGSPVSTSLQAQEITWAKSYAASPDASILSQYAQSIISTDPNAAWGLTEVQGKLTDLNTLAQSNGLIFCLYEGGLEDYAAGNDLFNSITAITRGATTVFTIGAHAFQVGWSTTISGVGGTTGLNGNTYTVSAITGTTITLNVDSSAMGAYTSGGAATYTNSGAWMQALRPALQDCPDVRAIERDNYLKWFLALGNTEFPSEFQLSGAVNATNPWAILHPDIYTGTSAPRWQAIEDINGSNSHGGRALGRF